MVDDNNNNNKNDTFVSSVVGIPSPEDMNRETSIGSEQQQQQQIIELYTTRRERELYDEQANLYSIIVATEHLERSYARDAISQKEYVIQCKKLLSQFKLAERVIRDTIGSTETFMKMYNMDCPHATERLLKMGVPEPTMKGGVGGDVDDVVRNTAVTVAETVQHFITIMDAVKLEQRAVDELQPLLSDLMDAITRLPETPNDFEPNHKISKWLQKLNTMRAVDEINDEDSRQLYHDLDSAYSEFTRYLKHGVNK